MTAHHREPQNLDTHLNFRMSSEDKSYIEMAAQFKGLKPNTYARKRLLEAAKRDIEEMNQQNRLKLSEEDWEAFLEVMEAPVQLNTHLKKAMKAFQKKFNR